MNELELNQLDKLITTADPLFVRKGSTSWARMGRVGHIQVQQFISVSSNGVIRCWSPQSRSAEVIVYDSIEEFKADIDYDFDYED